MTNTERPTIPHCPYVRGIGWNEKFRAWKEENLPEEHREIWNAAASDASIAWSRRGGSPSGYWVGALNKAIDAVNEGREAELTWPNIEFNRAHLERENLKVWGHKGGLRGLEAERAAAEASA